MTIDQYVTGPQWSLPGLQVAAGRFPLAVEQHVMRMVALLVPGATTVTPHGRYYALHGLAAVESERQNLDPSAAMDLLRRMEVVMAGVSLLHEKNPAHASKLPQPHGADAIRPLLQEAGALNLSETSMPGSGYVKAQSGYWAPYSSSESLLGIVASSSALAPGRRCDHRALIDGLGELVELARQPSVDVATLEAASHLCLCAGGSAPDGVWLRTLLCQPKEAGRETKADRARRATAQLLVRTTGAASADLAASFSTRLGFGDLVSGDLLVASEEAEAWRGVILRRYSVDAWRRLWAWLVEQVVETISVQDLADRFADELPDERVYDFVRGLPGTTDSAGLPRRAEDELRSAGDSLPITELGVLVLGGLRAGELACRVGEAFRGRPVELAPEWVSRRIEIAGNQHLRDFGRDLARDLVVRSKRIAMSKMVRRADGTIWLPTRLHEKGGLLWRTSLEGASDVGMRITQLGTVLAGAGVFEWSEEAHGWTVTDAGADALA